MSEPSPIISKPGHRFTRLVLPFSIENGLGLTNDVTSPKSRFSDLQNRVLEQKCKVGRSGVEKQVWQVKQEKPDGKILQHVHEFFFAENQNSDSRYVLSFDMDKNARPDLFSHELYFQSKKILCSLKFAEVNLFLFRSGIGMLVMDLVIADFYEPESGNKCAGVTMDNQRNLNFEVVRWRYGSYRLHKANPKRDRPKDVPAEDEITMEHLLAEMLAPIGKRKEAWNAMTQDFLGYTYLFLSEEEKAPEGSSFDYKKIKNTFYSLYRFLDEKHQPSKRQIRLENNPWLPKPTGHKNCEIRRAYGA